MFEVGIDIEDINRFKKYSLENNEYFLNEIYTAKELTYCFSSPNPAKHLAGKFCAKEAFIKACSSLNIDIKMHDIEILNDDTGKPYISEIESLKKYIYKLSISHEKDKAVAIVFINEVFQ